MCRREPTSSAPSGCSKKRSRPAWSRTRSRASVTCRWRLSRAERWRDRRRSIVHQEAAQLLAAARVAKLAQCLRLYLADAFARDVELLADLLEGVIGIHVDAEAHAQHLRFSRRELRQHRVRGLAERFGGRRVDRRGHGGILDEVPE